MPQFIDEATKAVIEKLKGDRVLEVIREGNEVHFDEMCDECFRVSLSLEETKLFANYLLSLVGDK
jgi:hypothetical protein